MKKTILFLLTVLLLACNSDDNNDNPVIIPDVILGRWIIYKTVYEETTVYEHEINGQCGQEALEMLADKNVTYVTETFYSNADCTGFTATTNWKWVKTADGVYDIYRSTSLVPERTLILTGSEIKVTTPGNVTVVKYYKRAL